MERFKCVRCGHEWWPRTPNKPRRCAGCKAPYWDRPARVPAPITEKKPVGGVNKYQLNTLEIGQSIILPWYFVGIGPDESKNKVMGNAVLNYARRHNQVLKREPTHAGLKVTRAA